MTGEVINVSWLQLSFGILFVVILLGISLYESLKLEKTIVIGAIRTTVQLIFVGFILKAVFTLDKWYVILLILIIMTLIASQTLIKRIKSPVKGSYIFALIAVSIASALSLFLLTGLIIQVDPWYDPQYLIPLAGMIIANGMNGAALAGERYRSELHSRLPEIEMLLSLGFDYKSASQKARQRSLSAALIPSLNNMMIMGIVSLPGMMSGQILAGNSPVTAVKYQILIIISLAATVLMTSWILITLLNKKFFTPHHQIRYDLINQNLGD